VVLLVETTILVLVDKVVTILQNLLLNQKMVLTLVTPILFVPQEHPIALVAVDVMLMTDTVVNHMLLVLV